MDAGRIAGFVMLVVLSTAVGFGILALVRDAMRGK